MDVASSKKGLKMPKKREKRRGHGNPLPKGVRSKSSTTQATRSEQNDSRSAWECLWSSMTEPPGNELMHIIVDVRCDECYFYVKSYIKLHVKTNVKLINALSAQSLSDSKSIAIWPTTAKWRHPASLRHCRQPGFHEAHPQLSIDCEGDQETRDNRDRNC